MRTSSAARRFVTRAPLAAGLIVVLPVLSAAQEPVKSFDQLGGVLNVGNKVRVTDTEDREISGRITALDGMSITIDKAGGTTLSADRVRRVERLKRSKGYGALIGVGVGVIGALAAANGADAESAVAAAILILPMGAGVGTLVGAFVTRSQDVYRTTGPSGSARLSLTPVITPRARGLAMVYTF